VLFTPGKWAARWICLREVGVREVGVREVGVREVTVWPLREYGRSGWPDG